MTERTAIRHAVPDEAGRLLALVRRIDGESDLLPREPGERPVWCAGTVAPADGLAGFLARPHCALLVAVADGEPVGFLSAAGGRLASTRGVVTLSAGVRRDQQGRGLGTRLFQAAEGWAWRAGARRLDLTVLTVNERAERLYRRLDYADEGVVRDSQRVRGLSRDERLMAKLTVDAIAPDWPPLELDPPRLRPPPGPPPVIRPARPDDAAAFLDCDRGVRDETPFLLRTAAESLTGETAARRFLTAQRAAPRATTLVAAAEDGIAGMVSVWTERLARGAHVALLAIALRRDQWGQGTGRRLLAAAEAWATARGFARVILRVPGHAARVQRVFTAAGYERQAVARRYALIDGGLADLHIMAKALTAPPAAPLTRPPP